ncbi:hypothetical protein M9978_02280 [Sphingomonas sp. MG17]|uniref:Phage holin T7 family, holin superfamily II n=1 Tax=Sphingomonas tagetis TaxID=2949092 RepID=A0A9X2HL57_9SPHN|nr:hypothetical protein [Sphingomonas tagetis]MCP3729243.1 hypothetical protein [Sphingomonas tagetis]
MTLDIRATANLSPDLQEMMVQAGKATPSVAVTTITLAGVGLDQWVLIATLVYTVLQAGWFVYDKLIRRRSRGDDA